jgi:hypothetical protein
MAQFWVQQEAVLNRVVVRLGALLRVLVMQHIT